jgi:hypothetical protein
MFANCHHWLALLFGAHLNSTSTVNREHEESSSFPKDFGDGEIESYILKLKWVDSEVYGHAEKSICGHRFSSLRTILDHYLPASP